MSRPDADDAPADPVIRILVETIKKDDWTLIDAAWERTRARVRERISEDIHLRRDTAPDDRAFLREALEEVRDRDLLTVFIRELICEDLLPDDALQRITELPGAPTWEVQAFQNGVYRPVNAFLESKNLQAACYHVCRIDIDGDHAGTGVQVSPNLVATAAHVVEPLLQPFSGRSAASADYGSLRQAQGSLARLAVTFCDMEDYRNEDGLETYRQPGEIVSLHPDWLYWGSPRALSDDPTSGFDVTSTKGISLPDGPWDLALIRLAAPRQKPRPTRILDTPLPARPFQVNVLHHPNGGMAAGQPLLISRGQLTHLGAPPVRCLHDANTHYGSSGAPVFDSQWRMVALHQGGVQAARRGGTTSGRNRAVPAEGWRDHVAHAEFQLRDRVPYLTELRTSSDLTPYPYPVIGRRETQRRVWRGMRPDAAPQDRLLIVRGDPGTGRRFTKRLVREMVSSTDGVMAVLDVANALDDSVAGFAGRMAGALSAQLRLPDSAALTTEQRAIRDDLIPVLGDLLERLAGSRAVWLVLEGFGDLGAIPAPVTDVVSHLVDRLRDFPSLRLVLVGWTLTLVGYENAVEDLRPPTADDVVWYLCPPGHLPERDMVEAVRSYFTLVAKQQDVGYPTAQQIAVQLSQLLRREIDPGDGQ